MQALPMLIMAVVSTGFQMYSSYQEGKTAAAMAEYNAKIMEQQARQQGKVALIEARRLRDEKERYLGMQRAAFSATGFTLEGSPLEVMAETANQWEWDISLNTYDRQLKAANLEGQANIYRMQKAAAKMKATMGMIGSGLAGATDLATMGSMGAFKTPAKPASGLSNTSPQMGQLSGF